MLVNNERTRRPPTQNMTAKQLRQRLPTTTNERHKALSTPRRRLQPPTTHSSRCSGSNKYSRLHSTYLNRIKRRHLVVCTPAQGSQQTSGFEFKLMEERRHTYCNFQEEQRKIRMMRMQNRQNRSSSSLTFSRRCRKIPCIILSLFRYSERIKMQQRRVARINQEIPGSNPGQVS